MPRLYRQYARIARTPRKFVAARKRQSSSLIKSRKLYSKYTQPRTLSQTSEYPVRRTYLAGTINTGTSFQDGQFFFELRFLPEYTEFTTLYDQYRVDKLVFRFMPLTNAGVSGVLAEQPQPLITAVDFDGGTVGLTQDQLLSYESAQITSAFKEKVITIKPRAELLSTDSDAITVSASVAPSNTWWDCSNVKILHHGVRYGIPANTTMPVGYGVRWTVWCEVYITFKNTR